MIFSLTAQSDSPVENIPFHKTLTEDFEKAWVWSCVGNEDNSLFLMHVTDDVDWQDTIYYFVNGQFLTDVKIHKLWDSSPIGNIVFSPFSKKFYFCSGWGSSSGLWTVSQTGIKDEPLNIYNTPMKDGRGYLAVNKAGVWLLHDKDEQSGQLYKIEDINGNNIFSIPDSVQETSFNSFANFMNKKRTEATEKYEHEQCFKFTDYTLLICDIDENYWWVFDCVKEAATRYKGYLTASKKAELLDSEYQKTHEAKNQITPFQLSLQIFSIFCFVITALALVTLLIRRNRLKKNQAKTFKEHNKMIFDIQEKERAKISRDIHDSVVQDIRVLRLETENLVVDEGSKARQSKIADLATECIIKLRNICYNLAPAELTSHSEGDSSKVELISIINSLVQQFSARTHIPCVFKVDEGFEYPVLEKEKTQNLFRVIQEALTNVEKHSYATQTSIFLKKDNNSLLIYVTDDGIGCNPDEIAKKLNSKDHLGLRSMKDRMELINGSIEFFTNQNDGMEIKIELPLENA